MPLILSIMPFGLDEITVINDRIFKKQFQKQCVKSS